MGLAAGTPVDVNFYTFNEQCKGVDVDGIIGAVWLHEGYGSTHANGHESVARADAVKPQYDPYAGAETLVDRSIDDLRAIVSNMAWERNAHTTDTGADTAHVVVTNNWLGHMTYWTWDPATASYGT